MLELKQVCFSANDRPILKDVNLEVPDGQLMAITGPNGGGKSTLARIIAGIEQPDSGQILWNGEDITKLGITERAKLGLGYAFQQPVRFKGVSVFDLLRLAAGGQLTVSEACDFLSQVGLCAREYVDRMVDDKLSGSSNTARLTFLAKMVAISILFSSPPESLSSTIRSIYSRAHKPT